MCVYISTYVSFVWSCICFSPNESCKKVCAFFYYERDSELRIPIEFDRIFRPPPLLVCAVFAVHVWRGGGWRGDGSS